MTALRRSFYQLGVLFFLNLFFIFNSSVTLADSFAFNQSDSGSVETLDFPQFEDAGFIIPLFITNYMTHKFIVPQLLANRGSLHNYFSGLIPIGNFLMIPLFYLSSYFSNNETLYYFFFAPIYEEVVFRQFLDTVLLKNFFHLGELRIFLSAMIFAVGHHVPLSRGYNHLAQQQRLTGYYPQFFNGIALALAMDFVGLKASIGLHIAFNLFLK